MNKQTFVIAGGTTGVARQVVIELVKLGHNVVFGDVSSKDVADKLLSELKQYDGVGYFIPLFLISLRCNIA